MDRYYDGKLVIPMRKLVVILMMLLGLMLCATAQADSFTFNDVSVSLEVSSEKYFILTPDNLDENESWLTDRGMSLEATLADWDARGVRLQAWTSSGDACLEISAIQDSFADTYYDVNQVTSDERGTYRLGHSSDKNGYYRELGYDYTSAQWKNYKNIGRFLQLEYTRTVNGETYRGYARKTVRNGYSIHLDYQVYGRGLKSADKNALDDVMDTFTFLEIFPRPATSVSKLIFSAEPPTETNTGKFTVEGTGTAGVKIIGVIMRMSASDAYQFETTVSKKGKFELDVTLPTEGYWLMTYTAVNGDTVVEEGAFEGITYDKDLLTVTLDGKLPTNLTGNELTISGTTMKQTKVQCIIDGRYNKAITTNNSGKFSFTVDTSGEGDYNIVLVFEKKGYATRRFTSNAVRELTEEDRRGNIREAAVKPAYSTLKKKLAGYSGRYMVYTLNIQRVEKTSTGYLTFAGMDVTKAGVYKNIVVIRHETEPSFSAGDEVRMYLRCTGNTYQVTQDEGTEEYPYFDFEFIE
ncbi:MAG: hypothetical protein IJ418_16005 [Clostridia bacterium]|nr:hypothetical protein [Clostridia bacterium]